MGSIQFETWLNMFNLFMIALSVNSVLHKLWTKSITATVVIFYIMFFGITINLIIDGYIPPHTALLVLAVLTIHVYIRAVTGRPYASK